MKMRPGWDKSVHKAVVLGAGGAARGIVYALISRGVGRSRHRQPHARPRRGLARCAI